MNTYLFFIVTLLSLSDISPWAQAAQIGIDLFGSIANGIAEAKLHNKQLKEENTELNKKIVTTQDNSKIQNDNLFQISNVKEEFAQKVDNYKNNHILTIDDMNQMVYDLYTNYITQSKIFIKKCLLLLKRGAPQKELKILIQISTVAIKSAFLEYIQYIRQYNFQLQNITQIMETNEKKESIFTTTNINNNLVDPLQDLNTFIEDFNNFIENNQAIINTLWNTRKLLLNNTIMTFNNRTKSILESLQNAEEKERSKDVGDEKDIFFDIGPTLDTMKPLLFTTFDQVKENTNILENNLYKTIFLFQINTDKLQSIINYINSNENETINITLFLKNLYKEFTEKKESISAKSKQYIQSIKQNDSYSSMLVNIKEYIEFCNNNISTIPTKKLESSIREYKKIIIENETNFNAITQKIMNSVIQIFHINQSITSLINNIKSIKNNIKQKNNLNTESKSEITITNNTSILNKKNISPNYQKNVHGSKKISLKKETQKINSKKGKKNGEK